MSVLIAESHHDLLTRPIHAVFTTMMPDGQPQSSLVWCDEDGQCARVNTTRERQQGRNMLADPKVPLLVVDPEDTSCYIRAAGSALSGPGDRVRHQPRTCHHCPPQPRPRHLAHPVSRSQPAAGRRDWPA